MAVGIAQTAWECYWTEAIRANDASAERLIGGSPTAWHSGAASELSVLSSAGAAQAEFTPRPVKTPRRRRAEPFARRQISCAQRVISCTRLNPTCNKRRRTNEGFMWRVAAT